MKAVLFAILMAGAAPVAAQVPTGKMTPLRPDQQQFLSLFKQLVETNTTLSAGDCTRAASQVRDRLSAAGIPDSQLTLFTAPDHPKEGGLVAVYPGTSKALKPMLLLAHIDVVEAKRADWVREPFQLIEDGEYLYARGVADDKAMAATWADTLVRYAQGHIRPKRTIKMALTCGEETDTAFNGARYLAENKRDLIDAGFALNEGGGGDTDGKGHLVGQSVQVGEKIYQDFKLTATNPGGHSSTPVADNAIYAMANALQRIAGNEFPMEFSDTTRRFFTVMGKSRKDAIGDAMARLAANPHDQQAEGIVNQDRYLHSMLRTTCVATMIEGGHAVNALPQRVQANVNCRIFPTHTPAEVKAALEKVVADPRISFAYARADKPLAKMPPLDPAIVGPMEALSTRYFPGVPFAPVMSTGATDAVYLSAAGIPTYGVPGAWGDPDGNGVHGLNERIEKRSLFVGRDYLFDLVGKLAN